MKDVKEVKISWKQSLRQGLCVFVSEKAAVGECREVTEGKEQSIINELSLGYQFAWNLTVLAHKIPCPGKPLVLGKLG